MTKRIKEITYQPLLSNEKQTALHFERLANDTVAIDGCLYPLSRSTEGYDGHQIEYEGEMLRLVTYNGESLTFVNKENKERAATIPSFESITYAQWVTIVEENPVILDSQFICFWDVFCSLGAFV